MLLGVSAKCRLHHVSAAIVVCQINTMRAPSDQGQALGAFALAELQVHHVQSGAAMAQRGQRLPHSNLARDVSRRLRTTQVQGPAWVDQQLGRRVSLASVYRLPLATVYRLLPSALAYR